MSDPDVTLSLLLVFCIVAPLIVQAAGGLHPMPTALDVVLGILIIVLVNDDAYLF